MFGNEKYIYINANEYKVSVKQVSGLLQINELSVVGKTRRQLKDRLNDTLIDVLDVLAELNKEIAEEKEKLNKKKLKEEKKINKD